jgi:hypothetical protein
MPNISRRHFLRNASIGAAATGVAAAGGFGLLTGVSGADTVPPNPLKTNSPDTPLLEGSGVIAHVVDAKKGEISLFVGTKHVHYTNQALAQELLKATR